MKDKITLFIAWPIFTLIVAFMCAVVVFGMIIMWPFTPFSVISKNDGRWRVWW